MRNGILQITKIALLATLIYLLFLAWPAPMTVEGRTGPPARPRRVLLSLDGSIPLLDAPCSKVTRQVVGAGALVEVLGQASHCGREWALVRRLEGRGEGWVPLTALGDPAAIGPTFGNVYSCPGDRIAPARPCAGALSASAGGLWLSVDVAGLVAGRRIGRRVLIDGVPAGGHVGSWRGAGSGHLLINVAEDVAAPLPGRWTVVFTVDDLPVASVAFDVAP